MEKSKSVKEIKEQLQAACEDELPVFIETYADDGRESVRKLLDTARRRINALKLERERIRKLWEYERKYERYTYICGVDEVGRGPLAGPVVAGAVILPKDCGLLYINDSKQLSEKKREELFLEIEREPLPGGSTRSTSCRPPTRRCGRPLAGWIPSRSFC